jgi:UDP-N-acetylmuramate dehydrogenase
LTESLFARIAGEVRGTVLRGEPMARHTSLRVGGPADYFIVPADRADLEGLLALLAETRLPYLVVGGGCNLLVRDGGFRGAVISLERFDSVRREGDRIVRAGAGADNRKLAGCAGENRLSGLEFLVGIPGRVGGALAMNAGAGGQAITDCLESLVTWRSGEVAVAGKDELEFGYRFLALAPGEIILEAAFALREVTREEIDRRTGEHLAHRRGSQLVGYPNAGSFFRNPAGASAWRLIEQAGFRGVRVGGAQVSEVHANFLVNRGSATATDFLALAARIKDAVRQSTGVELEEEVKIVGEG